MNKKSSEVLSIRYSGFLDDFNKAKSMKLDDFFMINGTHIIPKENLRQVLLEGSKALLKYEGSSDLIVQIKG